MSTTKLIAVDPAVRAEVEELIFEHAWRLDHHESDNLAEFYTTDGRMVGVGAPRTGHEAINAWGTNRAKMTDRNSRHIYTNLRVRQSASGLIEATTVVTLFRHDGAELGAAEPIAVADTIDTIKRDSDGRLKFVERKTVVAFESAAHKH